MRKVAAIVQALFLLILGPGLPSMQASADPAHVTRIQPDADGTTRITLFEVPSGSSATQVYADLAAAGVTHLVDPQAVVAASTCQYGYAIGLGDNPSVWPCYHWANNGYSDPQVYFRDWTPAQWPIDAAVYEWNKAVGIDSYYIWKDYAYCPSISTGKHCVNVYSGVCPLAGLAGKVGCTDFWVDGANQFIDGSVNVWLNGALANGEDNRGTACHELGHALGVGHNQRDPEKGNSCMGPSVPGPDRAYPSSEDFALLKCRLYPPYPADC